MIELGYYQEENGRRPFTEWLTRLRDKVAKARIAARLRQIQLGNLGDAKPVGEGVTELRIHAGAGYRVYFANDSMNVVLLLVGGSKKTQARDIATAQRHWLIYKRE